MRKYQVRDLGMNRWDIVFHDDANGRELYSPHIYFSYERAVEIADALEKANVSNHNWELCY